MRPSLLEQWYRNEFSSKAFICDRHDTRWIDTALFKVGRKGHGMIEGYNYIITSPLYQFEKFRLERFRFLLGLAIQEWYRLHHCISIRLDQIYDVCSHDSELLTPMKLWFASSTMRRVCVPGSRVDRARA